MTLISRFSYWLCLLLLLAGCQTLQSTEAPYVILVSIDGLRAGSYTSVETPALDRIAAEGVHASGMRPVFPSMTFPNHYSIATGLYPFEHGIVDNAFPNSDRTDWYAIRNRDAVGDGRWYGGEPIWVTAEKHGVVSAAYFFVGTEADIGGVRPTYWRQFDNSIPGEERVDQALDWLALPEPERPRLITLYFEDVDDAGHRYGPGSEPHEQAMMRVDAYLQRLVNGIERLAFADNAYIVIVSDHGQVLLRDDTPPFALEDLVSLDGFLDVEHTSYVSLFMESYDQKHATEFASRINDNWQHGRAYTRDNAPKHWRIEADQRFGDVIVIADPGFTVISGRNPDRRIAKGNHGYDPTSVEMQATFIARGPRLPVGKSLGQVYAVDVYPLLTEMLQLPLPAGYKIQHNDLRELLSD